MGSQLPRTSHQRRRSAQMFRAASAALAVALVLSALVTAAPSVALDGRPQVAAVRQVFAAAPTPAITGTARVGSTLTAKPGKWSPSSVSLTYRWYRGSEAISGATRTVYKVSTADAGKKITVRVTGKKPGYTTVTKKSAARTIEGLPTVTPTPTVTGAARVGSTLTAKPGKWSPSSVSLTYRWYRGSEAISGATRTVYKVSTADAGKKITVRVTGKKPGYTTVTKVSASLTIDRPLTATPVPTISGAPTIGTTLTVAPGVWAPSPVTLTRQWLREGAVIPGAIDAEYTVSSDDAGARLSVQVTGTKAGYVPIARVSVATARVVGGPQPITGTLNSDTAWTVDQTPLVVIAGELTVAEDVTLTIGAGVVVAFTELDGETDGQNWGRLVVAGDLQVRGTTQAPVVLTHLSDALNGEDSTGLYPRWGGVEIHGQATIEHADIRWTIFPLYANYSQGPVTVTDSVIDGTVWMQNDRGVGPALRFERNTLRFGDLDVNSGSCTVRGNTFVPTASGVTVMELSCGDIHPAQISSNTATEAAIATISGDLYEDWALPGPSNLSWALRSVRAYDGAAITVPAGATVYGSGALELRRRASFTSAGTAAAPVTIKPYAPWTGEMGWDTQSFWIDTQGGSVQLAHTDFQAVGRDGNSVMTGKANGGGLGHEHVITDSHLAGGIDVVGSEITLERNIVDGRIEVEAYSDAGMTVIGNTVAPVDSALPAIALSSSGHFETTGFESNRSQTPGTITVEGEIDQDWTVPVLDNLSWADMHLTVGTDQAAAALTIPAGMSLDGGRFWVRNGALDVRGTATAPVTLADTEVTMGRGRLSAQYVNLTGASWIDAYEGEVLLDDVNITQVDAPVDGGEGSFCLHLGSVTGHLRGTVSGCEVGVQSSSFQSFDARYVDWGGTGPAPLGSGTRVVGNVAVVPWVGYVAPPALPTLAVPAATPPVCAPYMMIAVRGSGETPGGPWEVTLDPTYYDHFSFAQMTDSTHSSATQSGQFAYAARGLGAKVQTILTGQVPLNGEPWLVEDTSSGLLDRAQFDVDTNVSVAPLIYPADSTDLLLQMVQPTDTLPFFTLRVDKFARYLSSIAVGVERLDRELTRIEEACPDSQISLFGYSQGAMVIHMALADRAASNDTEVFDKINAVVLLANPLNDPQSDAMTNLGTAAEAPDARGLIKRVVLTSAGRSLTESLNDLYDDDLSGMMLPYPPSLARKTVSYCAVGDLLCSPSFNIGTTFADMVDVHSGYDSDQLSDLSQYIAQYFPVPAAG